MRGIFQTPSCTTYSYDFSDRIDSSVAMTLCRNTHPPSSAWLKQVPDRFSLLVVGWWHQDTSVYVCEPFYSGVSPTTDTGRAGWRPAGPTNYCNSGCCLLDRLLTKTNVILVSFVFCLFVRTFWLFGEKFIPQRINGQWVSKLNTSTFELFLTTANYVRTWLSHPL